MKLEYIGRSFVPNSDGTVVELENMTIGKEYKIIEYREKSSTYGIHDDKNELQFIFKECFRQRDKYENFFNKTKGIKHDNNKLKPTLLFDDMPLAIREVLRVLDYGAKKYSEGNQLKVEDGMKRYRNACDRHRLEGSIDQYDDESRLLHLAHEATNALMLLELKLRELQDK